MTRLGSVVLCTIVGTGLLACSSTESSPASKTAAELAPVENAVSGWVIDTASNRNQSPEPMIANSVKEAVALIDGAANPFYKAPNTPQQFLWQNYVNDTLPAAPAADGGAHLILYILKMPSADTASGLYTALLQESEYFGKQGTSEDWQPTSPLLGTESRIEDTGTLWWINLHKGDFYVEVMFFPSYGPAPDYTPGNADLKQEAIRFAQAIASKI